MKLSIMQPYIFPYIGYYQLCFAADKFVFLDDVNFINKGWINRNNIQQKGNKVLFTVPLKKASQNSLINEIFVSDEHKWKQKLFVSFEHAYKKAPFYEERIALIKSVFDFDTITIEELAKRSITYVLNEIGIKTQIIESSSIYNNKDLDGPDRIINICEKEKATQYINPIGGTELYNKEDFEAKGIDLKFIKTLDIQYNQGVKEFIPYLSMIDVLMYNSNETIRTYLTKHELV